MLARDPVAEVNNFGPVNVSQWEMKQVDVQAKVVKYEIAILNNALVSCLSCIKFVKSDNRIL